MRPSTQRPMGIRDLGQPEGEALPLPRPAGRPALFYTVAGQALLFASEMKSLFAVPQVSREIDPVALDQIFTFWVTLPPRTTFKGVRELPPAIR